MLSLKSNFVGIKEVKALYWPKPRSHKGQNGILLIIAGSSRYHGAPIFTAKIASRIVDLIYFSSVPENNKLLEKMKLGLAEFITVNRDEIDNYIRKVDAVLIGPGMEVVDETKIIVNSLLKRYKNKKFILDADALKVVDLKLLGPNVVITPHKGEFEMMFDKKPLAKNVQQMAKKHNCIIVLKAPKDIICSPKECKYNITGNQGMTKGGTGDVLAGLIAGLACKNDLYLAAKVGTFLNGLAGDQLFERVSYYYNASDLADQIPKTIKWCLEFK